MRIVLSIIGIVVGIIYIKYSDTLTRATGSIGWAEDHLGGGGTYTLHKLIGLAIIVISIFSMTGSFQWLMSVTIGRLFPGGS